MEFAWLRALPDVIRRVRSTVRMRVALSLGITLAFVVVEGVAGLLANSLALLTDAAHNLTDVLALSLTWFAMQMQARPPGASNTYGYHRVGILVALANSATLVVVSLGILYEAYRRLVEPPEVRADILVLVGLMALMVNVGTAMLIRRRDETDLNLRSAFVHLAGDAASTGGAVLAGVIMLYMGAAWLDPVVSALIAVLIIANAWKILREAVEILLEATPRDVDLGSMVGNMMRIEGVLGVHDLHVWSLSRGLRAMSAHVLIDDDVPLSAAGRIRAKIRNLLSEEYKIPHSTLQLEFNRCGAGELFCHFEGVDRP